jgi:hypothetical protein
MLPFGRPEPSADPRAVVLAGGQARHQPVVAVHYRPMTGGRLASYRSGSRPGGQPCRTSRASSTGSPLTERGARAPAAEGGAAVVEFVLVSLVAVVLAMSLAQLGLFLWERNALMGSLSEGARVAATEGRTVADGRRLATELLRRSAGGRVASAVPIEGVEVGGVVVLSAEGTLPSFVPGVPGLPVRMRARMHEEGGL